MVDRAACYIHEKNLIKANRDFQGYIDITNSKMKEHGDKPGADQIISDEVRKIFEQQLMDSVTGALSLKGRSNWTRTDIEKAFSEEALTTAVSGRFFVMTELNRQLKNRLGHNAMKIEPNNVEA